MNIIELGCAGHLVVANRCNWRRHTQIGDKYRVSTVGNYFPDGRGKRETIGAENDSFFETMVFETLPSEDHDNDGCGCLVVKSWSEIDGDRYATAGEAQAGHERFIQEYTAKAEISQ